MQCCRHWKAIAHCLSCKLYTVYIYFTSFREGLLYSHILCSVVFVEHIVYSERSKEHGESHYVNARGQARESHCALLFGCFAKVFCLSTDLSWLPTDQANCCQVS